MSLCQRTNCKREATLVDYRPSYIDDNGEADCVGKVVTCEPCTSLTGEDWVMGVEPVEEEE
jgi:hypothetical protein